MGAGRQSSALVLLMRDGVLPVVDAAIFADTQWEPEAVYVQLHEYIEPVLDALGVPLIIASRGNIRDDHLDAENPFSSMPLFVRGDDNKERLGRRQCTHDYKLRIVRAETRRLLGYPPPERVPKGVYAETWVGFSADEVFRMNPDRSPGYACLTHPLADLGITAKDCERMLRREGWPVVKSSCIGCPFHGNAYWRDMRDNRPDEWADAVAFDHAIRTAPRGSRSAMRGEQFIHRSLLPLDEAPIDRVSRREWNDRQVDLLDVVAEDGDPDGCSPYGCRSGLVTLGHDESGVA